MAWNPEAMAARLKAACKPVDEAQPCIDCGNEDSAHWRVSREGMRSGPRCCKCHFATVEAVQ